MSDASPDAVSDVGTTWCNVPTTRAAPTKTLFPRPRLDLGRPRSAEPSAARLKRNAMVPTSCPVDMFTPDLQDRSTRNLPGTLRDPAGVESETSTPG
jgi:hypothetical protein